MRKTLPFVMILLCFACSPSGAETIAIDASRSLQVDLPGGKWQLTREAPSFLVEESVEHLTHEVAAKGQKVSLEKVREVARRRLGANEAYLCQSESRACLVVDISPLRPGEDPPTAKSVRLSAKFAAEGLKEEEGIEGLKQTVRPIRVPGSSYTYRIDASYRQHGEKRKFIGIVAFAHPCWIYLYYTDPLRDPADAGIIEKVLTSASVLPGGTSR